MTFCLGIKLKEGLVGIADTRITAGAECLSAKKVLVKQNPQHHQSMFLMTSGLRSLRDKAVTYFEEELAHEQESCNKLYKVVNQFGQILRRVASEDKKALEGAAIKFNLFALIAGQFEDDDEHKLYMIYPEGNWVEVGERTPFFIIGNSAHGRPILDRVLKHDASFDYALKVGFLSFNATQVSANDVAYPIDVVLYKKDSFQMVTHRYELDDLKPYALWWQERITQSVDEMPDEWIQSAFEEFNK